MTGDSYTLPLFLLDGEDLELFADLEDLARRREPQDVTDDSVAVLDSTGRSFKVHVDGRESYSLVSDASFMSGPSVLGAALRRDIQAIVGRTRGLDVPVGVDTPLTELVSHYRRLIAE